MSFTESVRGIHECATVGDVLAIFGHDTNYIVCSRRSLITRTEATGVSMAVKTSRSSVRQPQWSPKDGNVRQVNVVRNEPDCLWPTVNRDLVVGDVGFLFESYEDVWLMRGGGFMWFRGYSQDSGTWLDSVNKWPEKPL